MAKGQGAWVPLEIAVCLPRLTLRRASQWQVFSAVFITWCRYGRNEARLSIKEICEATGLARRTVQKALAELIAMGVIRRVARQRRLIIVPEALIDHVNGWVRDNPSATSDADPHGADKRAPQRRIHPCASVTSVTVHSEADGKVAPAFTNRQLHLIHDVLTEAAELLGSDPTALSIPSEFSASLGFPEGTTYATAMRRISASGTPQLSARYTAAVLALRRDQRVQGMELPMTSEGSIYQ